MAGATGAIASGGVEGTLVDVDMVDGTTTGLAAGVLLDCIDGNVIVGAALTGLAGIGAGSGSTTTG